MGTQSASETLVKPATDGTPLKSFPQECVVEHRRRWDIFVIFLERYIDNVILHLFMLLLSGSLAVARFSSPKHAPVTESHPQPPYLPADFSLSFGWFILVSHCILLSYALYDVITLLLTAQVKLSPSLDWLDLMLDVVCLALAILDPLRSEIPQLLFLKFFVNGPRYIQKCRILVCVNKRMYKDDEFHLDLSYLTSRTIAMGLPAEGLPWLLYRNRIKDVSRFFHKFYPASHLIVNMCDECSYDIRYFHRVELCPTPDHEVPPLQMLLNLCYEVEAFLKSVPNSVVAFHCKGGKGRTGLVAVCWLLYSGFCETAFEGIQLMAERRTEPSLFGGLKTVTTSCQVRFLTYFEELVVRQGGRIATIGRTVTLRKARLSGLKSKKGKLLLCNVWIRVKPHPHNATWPIFDSKSSGKVTWLDERGVAIDAVRSNSSPNCFSGSCPAGMEWLPCEARSPHESDYELHVGDPHQAEDLLAESSTPLLAPDGDSASGPLREEGSGSSGQNGMHVSRMCGEDDAVHYESAGTSSLHLRSRRTPSGSATRVAASRRLGRDEAQSGTDWKQSGSTLNLGGSRGMHGVISVEVMYGPACSSRSKVLGFAWLHADYLEIPQPNLLFKKHVSENKYALVDPQDKPRINTGGAVTVVELPLIGSRDFDFQDLKKHAKGLRLDLTFEFSHQQ